MKLSTEKIFLIVLVLVNNTGIKLVKIKSKHNFAYSFSLDKDLKTSPMTVK